MLEPTKKLLNTLYLDQADLIDENTLIRIITESLCLEITSKNSNKKKLEVSCKLIDILKEWINQGFILSDTKTDISNKSKSLSINTALNEENIQGGLSKLDQISLIKLFDTVLTQFVPQYTKIYDQDKPEQNNSLSIEIDKDLEYMTGKYKNIEINIPSYHSILMKFKYKNNGFIEHLVNKMLALAVIFIRRIINDCKNMNCPIKMPSSNKECTDTSISHHEYSIFHIVFFTLSFSNIPSFKPVGQAVTEQIIANIGELGEPCEKCFEFKNPDGTNGNKRKFSQTMNDTNDKKNIEEYKNSVFETAEGSNNEFSTDYPLDTVETDNSSADQLNRNVTGSESIEDREINPDKGLNHSDKSMFTSDNEGVRNLPQSCKPVEEPFKCLNHNLLYSLFNKLTVLLTDIENIWFLTVFKQIVTIYSQKATKMNILEEGKLHGNDSEEYSSNNTTYGSDKSVQTANYVVRKTELESDEGKNISGLPKLLEVSKQQLFLNTDNTDLKFSSMNIVSVLNRNGYKGMFDMDYILFWYDKNEKLLMDWFIISESTEKIEISKNEQDEYSNTSTTSISADNWPDSGRNRKLRDDFLPLFTHYLKIVPFILRNLKNTLLIKFNNRKKGSHDLLKEQDSALIRKRLLFLLLLVQEFSLDTLSFVEPFLTEYCEKFKDPTNDPNITPGNKLPDIDEQLDYLIMEIMAQLVVDGLKLFETDHYKLSTNKKMRNLLIKKFERVKIDFNKITGRKNENSSNERHNSPKIKDGAVHQEESVVCKSQDQHMKTVHQEGMDECVLEEKRENSVNQEKQIESLLIPKKIDPVLQNKLFEVIPKENFESQRDELKLVSHPAAIQKESDEFARKTNPISEKVQNKSVNQDEFPGERNPISEKIQNKSVNQEKSDENIINFVSESKNDKEETDHTQIATCSIQEDNSDHKCVDDLQMDDQTFNLNLTPDESDKIGGQDNNSSREDDYTVTYSGGPFPSDIQNMLLLLVKNYPLYTIQKIKNSVLDYLWYMVLENLSDKDLLVLFDTQKKDRHTMISKNKRNIREMYFKVNDFILEDHLKPCRSNKSDTQKKDTINKSQSLLTTTIHKLNLSDVQILLLDAYKKNSGEAVIIEYLKNAHEKYLQSIKNETIKTETIKNEIIKNKEVRNIKSGKALDPTITRNSKELTDQSENQLLMLETVHSLMLIKPFEEESSLHFIFSVILAPNSLDYKKKKNSFDNLDSVTLKFQILLLIYEKNLRLLQCSIQLIIFTVFSFEDLLIQYYNKMKADFFTIYGQEDNLLILIFKALKKIHFTQLDTTEYFIRIILHMIVELLHSRLKHKKNVGNWADSLKYNKQPTVQFKNDPIPHEDGRGQNFINAYYENNTAGNYIRKTTRENQKFDISDRYGDKISRIPAEREQQAYIKESFTNFSDKNKQNDESKDNYTNPAQKMLQKEKIRDSRQNILNETFRERNTQETHLKTFKETPVLNLIINTATQILFNRLKNRLVNQRTSFLVIKTLSREIFDWHKDRTNENDKTSSGYQSRPDDNSKTPLYTLLQELEEYCGSYQKFLSQPCFEPFPRKNQTISNKFAQFVFSNEKVKEARDDSAKRANNLKNRNLFNGLIQSDTIYGYSFDNLATYNPNIYILSQSMLFLCYSPLCMDVSFYSLITSLFLAYPLQYGSVINYLENHVQNFFNTLDIAISDDIQESLVNALTYQKTLFHDFKSNENMIFPNNQSTEHQMKIKNSDLPLIHLIMWRRILKMGNIDQRILKMYFLLIKRCQIVKCCDLQEIKNTGYSPKRNKKSICESSTETAHISITKSDVISDVAFVKVILQALDKALDVALEDLVAGNRISTNLTGTSRTREITKHPSKLNTDPTDSLKSNEQLSSKILNIKRTLETYETSRPRSPRIRNTVLADTNILPLIINICNTFPPSIVLPFYIKWLKNGVSELCFGQTCDEEKQLMIFDQNSSIEESHSSTEHTNEMPFLYNLFPLLLNSIQTGCFFPSLVSLLEISLPWSYKALLLLQLVVRDTEETIFVQETKKVLLKGHSWIREAQLLPHNYNTQFSTNHEYENYLKCKYHFLLSQVRKSSQNNLKIKKDSAQTANKLENSDKIDSECKNTEILNENPETIGKKQNNTGILNQKFENFNISDIQSDRNTETCVGSNLKNESSTSKKEDQMFSKQKTSEIEQKYVSNEMKMQKYYDQKSISYRMKNNQSVQISTPSSSIESDNPHIEQVFEEPNNQERVSSLNTDLNQDEKSPGIISTTHSTDQLQVIPKFGCNLAFSGESPKYDRVCCCCHTTHKHTCSSQKTVDILPLHTHPRLILSHLLYKYFFVLCKFRLINIGNLEVLTRCAEEIHEGYALLVERYFEMMERYEWFKQKFNSAMDIGTSSDISNDSQNGTKSFQNVSRSDSGKEIHDMIGYNDHVKTGPVDSREIDHIHHHRGDSTNHKIPNKTSQVDDGALHITISGKGDHIFTHRKTPILKNNSDEPLPIQSLNYKDPGSHKVMSENINLNILNKTTEHIDFHTGKKKENVDSEDFLMVQNEIFALQSVLTSHVSHIFTVYLYEKAKYVQLADPQKRDRVILVLNVILNIVVKERQLGLGGKRVVDQNKRLTALGGISQKLAKYSIELLKLHDNELTNKVYRILTNVL